MKNLLAKINRRENNIRELENEVLKIKKNFKKEKKPLFDIGSTYFISKIDNALFEIVRCNTSEFDREIKSYTIRSLNYITEFEDNKLSEKEFNMRLAENSLMYVYVLRNCGKNGKAKKIGYRTHIITEYEMINYLNEGLLVEGKLNEK